MKRDSELITLLLLEAEGEEPKPDLSRFAEQAVTQHAAYLVENCFLKGQVISGNSGEAEAVATLGLTERGYDYLDELCGLLNQQTDAPIVALDVFVSHSSKDKPLALALVELMRAALNLEPARVRCTSVEGYKLPIGVNSDDQLKLEVHGAKAFVGLLTPTSLRSSYIRGRNSFRFELLK